MKKNILLYVTLAILTFQSTSFADEKKNINIHFAPIPLLAGIVNISGDIEMGETWTLGPTFNYFDTPDFAFMDFKIISLGARINKHFFGKAMEDSMYLGGGLSIAKVEGSFLWVSSEAAYTVIPEISLGYQWMWDNFNLRLGGGFGLSIPYLDFTLGWVF